MSHLQGALDFVVVCVRGPLLPCGAVTSALGARALTSGIGYRFVRESVRTSSKTTSSILNLESKVTCSGQGQDVVELLLMVSPGAV